MTDWWQKPFVELLNVGAEIRARTIELVAMEDSREESGPHLREILGKARAELSELEQRRRELLQQLQHRRAPDPARNYRRLLS
ncbi:hypothetical protein LJ656_34660 [Paraburkholderia sp. MMS20-SJTR3]|uniref:Uncharacterized protein n=1 Tax=Paraburkholderia sejongensis TaxID=2886946 RepID=A0ABS8K6S0_9BURK|nr:hypothetical protein [Paraburkholderia sp. MMS20-SJTR3]MCC8397680.1 hypothetical protein [Paraburkholderia sp. MMS20-SJTR3]